MRNSFIELLLIFVRGLLMGTADLLPGISGGTVALITGIYERLIHSIGKISFKFIKPLFRGDFSNFKKGFLDEIDFQLFIPLLLGIVVAVVAMSKIINFLLDEFTAFTFALILGLILASSYVLYNQVVYFSSKIILISVIGFILAYIFVGLNPIAANHTLPIIFFSGMLAICAMILPGISGAFVLLLVGQYDFMLSALSSLSWTEIMTFCFGALIGILSFSKVVDYLLKHHKEIIIALFIGVILGTLRIPIDKISANISGSLFDVILCIILMIIGFVVIVLLEMKFKQSVK